MAQGNTVDLILECPIHSACDGIPKILSCGHTVCLECIQHMYSHAKQADPTTRIISCPLCRKNTELSAGGPSELPNNFSLMQVREAMMTAQIDQKCDFCQKEEKEPFVSFCKDCEQHLCGSCAKEHKEIPIFSDHNIAPKSSIKCNKHKGYVTYYCSNCDHLLCKICLQHRICADHDVKKLKDISVEKHKELDDKLLNLAQGIEIFTEHREAMKAKVAEVRGYIRREVQGIENHANTLLEKIMYKKRNLLLTLQEQDDELSTMESRLQDETYLDKLLQIQHAANRSKENGIEDIIVKMHTLNLDDVPNFKPIEHVTKHMFLPDVSLDVGKLMEVKGQPHQRGHRSRSANSDVTSDVIECMVWELSNMSKCTSDVFVYPNGHLAVVHSIGNVFIADLEGNIIKDTKSKGITLKNPTGIDDYPEESALAVAENGTGCVVLLDATELILIRTIDLEGISKAYNIRVLGTNFATSYKDGDLVFIALHNGRGEKLKSWDCYSDDIKYPGRLGVDSEGNLLVAGLDRVWTYDYKGNLLHIIIVDYFTMGCASLGKDIIVAVSETGKSGELVACSKQEDGEQTFRTILTWTQEDYENFGGMRAVDLDGSFLAVTGSKGVRLYRLRD